MHRPHSLNFGQGSLFELTELSWLIFLKAEFWMIYISHFNCSWDDLQRLDTDGCFCFLIVYHNSIVSSSAMKELAIPLLNLGRWGTGKEGYPSSPIQRYSLVDARAFHSLLSLTRTVAFILRKPNLQSE